MSDTNDVLFVYVRYTDERRIVRAVWSADAKEFEADEDWINVGTIQPRPFIESMLQDNEIIFAGCFPKVKV